MHWIKGSITPWWDRADSVLSYHPPKSNELAKAYKLIIFGNFYFGLQLVLSDWHHDGKATDSKRQSFSLETHFV